MSENKSSWKDYIASSYRYVINEAWQLGVDAKNEAYNIYSGAWNNTSEIYTDVFYTGPSWSKKTEKPKKIEEDKKSEFNVFTVESNYEPTIMPESKSVQIKDALNSETTI